MKLLTNQVNNPFARLVTRNYNSVIALPFAPWLPQQEEYVPESEYVPDEDYEQYEEYVPDLTYTYKKRSMS